MNRKKPIGRFYLNKKAVVEDTLMVVIKVIITSLAILFILFPIVMMIIRMNFRQTSDDYVVSFANFLKNALEDPYVKSTKKISFAIPFSKIGEEYSINIISINDGKRGVIILKKRGVEFKKLPLNVPIKNNHVIGINECTSKKCFLIINKEEGEFKFNVENVK